MLSRQVVVGGMAGGADPPTLSGSSESLSQVPT